MAIALTLKCLICPWRTVFVRVQRQGKLHEHVNTFNQQMSRL